MTRILYLHGFASGPGSSKARAVSARLAEAGIPAEILDLAAGDFEHLTLTGQLAVIERAAAEAVSLIGSSMGGYLAALYAARHPEVQRLVLLAPAFDFARRWAGRLGAKAVDEWRRTGTTEVYHYAEQRNVPLHYGLLEDAARYEPFPDFRQPALIIHGSQDDIVPATLSQEFAARHDNVQLEVVDSGHELLNVVDYIAARTIEFLRGASINA